MRILHTESSVGWGGQEIRVLDESAGLIARGHTVAIAAPAEAQIALGPNAGVVVQRDAATIFSALDPAVAARIDEQHVETGPAHGVTTRRPSPATRRCPAIRPRITWASRSGVL